MRRATSLAAGVLAALLSVGVDALAQTDVTPVPDPADTTATRPIDAAGAGIAGGAILGGELVLIVEGAIGVQDTWPYLVFPILGAAGGGVGGYFLESSGAGVKEELSVAMLVTALALVVPTAVIVAAGSAWDPGDEPVADMKTRVITGDEEAAAPVTPAAAAPPVEATSTEVEVRPVPAPTETPPAPPPAGREQRPVAGAVLGLSSRGALSLGVPLVTVRPLPWSTERELLGRSPGVELNVPILSVAWP